MEIKNAQLLVNGVPLEVHGVNRHELEPTTGRVVTEAGMRRDLQVMKQFNINAGKLQRPQHRVVPGLVPRHGANQFINNYIRPQEGGYHTDVRWLTLTNATGQGLPAEGTQPLSFSALDVRAEELDPGLSKKQQHISDVKRHPGQVFLNVDLKQRGVGGDNSWGALPHDQYRLLDKQYRYSYTLRLVDGKSAATAGSEQPRWG